MLRTTGSPLRDWADNLIPYHAMLNSDPISIITQGNSTLLQTPFGLPGNEHGYLTISPGSLNGCTDEAPGSRWTGYSGVTSGSVPDEVRQHLALETAEMRASIEKHGVDRFVHKGIGTMWDYHRGLLSLALGLETAGRYYYTQLASGGTEGIYGVTQLGIGMAKEKGMNGIIHLGIPESASKAVEAAQGRATTTSNALGQTIEPGKLLEGIGYLPDDDNFAIESLLLSYESDGEPLPPSYHNRRIKDVVVHANKKNMVVIIPYVPGSKRGLEHNDLDHLRRLKEAYPDNVLIYIDNCQGRAPLNWQELIDEGMVVLTTLGKSQGVGVCGFLTANDKYLKYARTYFDLFPSVLPADVQFYFPSMGNYNEFLSVSCSVFSNDKSLNSVDISMLLRLEAYRFLQEELIQFQPQVREIITKKMIAAMAQTIQKSKVIHHIAYPNQMVPEILNVTVVVDDAGNRRALEGKELDLFHYAMATDCTYILGKSLEQTSPLEELLQLNELWGQPEDASDKHAVLRLDVNVQGLLHVLHILKQLAPQVNWQYANLNHEIIDPLMDAAVAMFITYSFIPNIQKANFIGRHWSILKPLLEQHMPPRPEKKLHDWRSINAQACARLRKCANFDQV